MPLAVVARTCRRAWRASLGDRYAFVWRLAEQRIWLVAGAVIDWLRPTPSFSHAAFRFGSGIMLATTSFESLDPLWLDRAVDWLATHGAHPYAVLEAWEVRDFRARFAARIAVGRLDMTPIARYESAHSPEIFIYDLLMPSTSRERLELIDDSGVSACPEPAPSASLVLK